MIELCCLFLPQDIDTSIELLDYYYWHVFQQEEHCWLNCNRDIVEQLGLSEWKICRYSRYVTHVTLLTLRSYYVNQFHIIWHVYHLIFNNNCHNPILSKSAATLHNCLINNYSGTSPYGHLTSVSKKTSPLQSPWLSPKLYSTVQITPCNKVTSALRSLLPSPVGDLNSEVPLYS